MSSDKCKLRIGIHTGVRAAGLSILPHAGNSTNDFTVMLSGVLYCPSFLRAGNAAVSGMVPTTTYTVWDVPTSPAYGVFCPIPSATSHLNGSSCLTSGVLSSLVRRSASEVCVAQRGRHSFNNILLGFSVSGDVCFAAFSMAPNSGPHSSGGPKTTWFDDR